jgi:hypothetical protein
MAARKQEGRGHTGASQQVLTYLREHCNTVIPYPELTKAIGAKEKFTVPNAITHLVAKGLPIERPMRGFALYRTIAVAKAPEPPTPESKTLDTEPKSPSQKYWEFVGNSGGLKIVKGEDEELYVVFPLYQYVRGNPE